MKKYYVVASELCGGSMVFILLTEEEWELMTEKEKQEKAKEILGDCE